MRQVFFMVLLALSSQIVMASGKLRSATGSVPSPKKAIVDTPKKVQPPTWFENNITIGQSMATTEQQQLPAQFTVTLPKNKPGSYLVNIGVGVNLNFLSTQQSITSKLTAEFHRNTLTDSVQNNYQIGIVSTFDLDAKKGKQGTHYIIITDPEYIVDRVKMQNSLAGNFLFTWNTDGGPINWSKNNFVFAKRGSFIPAVLVGTQVQQVFAGDTTAPKGFKLRPLATGNLSYLFFKANNEFDPVVRLLADYTQRITAINQTNDGEKWTHIFRAEADYFILLKPVKLSVGATFLNGSDIFAGLKQQQYFLLSLNLFAGKTN